MLRASRASPTMRRMRRVFVCVAAIGFWACSGPDEPSGTTPAGDRGDGDGEAGTETTVEASTGADEPEAEPLEVVEHDEACRPHDARGDGECDAIVGTFWRGSRCEQISGCRCVGDDCDDALGSMRECQELYAHCR